MTIKFWGVIHEQQYTDKYKKKCITLLHVGQDVLIEVCIVNED